MFIDVADDGFATAIGLCRLFDLFSGAFPPRGYEGQALGSAITR